MCVGAPMRVVALVRAPSGAEASDGVARLADCEADGRRERVDLSLVGEVAEGDWLLVFLGAARERLSPARAEEIRQALAGVAAAMRGEDPAAHFADLEAEGPRLPPHLEAARRRGDAVA